MVKLRLRRVGRKKLPIYKIVVADSRAPRDGRFIEAVGTYNPNSNPAQVNIKENRIEYWLKSGAQPTYTVKNLLSRKGVLLKLNLMRKGFEQDKIQEEFDKWLSYQNIKMQNEGQKKLKRKGKKKTAKGETAEPAGGTEPAKNAPQDAASQEGEG